MSSLNLGFTPDVGDGTRAADAPEINEMEIYWEDTFGGAGVSTGRFADDPAVRYGDPNWAANPSRPHLEWELPGPGTSFFFNSADELVEVLGSGILIDGILTANGQGFAKVNVLEPTGGTIMVRYHWQSSDPVRSPLTTFHTYPATGLPFIIDRTRDGFESLMAGWITADQWDRIRSTISDPPDLGFAVDTVDYTQYDTETSRHFEVSMLGTASGRLQAFPDVITGEPLDPITHVIDDALLDDPDYSMDVRMSFVKEGDALRVTIAYAEVADVPVWIESTQLYTFHGHEPTNTLALRMTSGQLHGDDFFGDPLFSLTDSISQMRVVSPLSGPYKGASFGARKRPGSPVIDLNANPWEGITMNAGDYDPTYYGDNGTPSYDETTPAPDPDSPSR